MVVGAHDNFWCSVDSECIFCCYHVILCMDLVWFWGCWLNLFACIFHPQFFFAADNFGAFFICLILWKLLCYVLEDGREFINFSLSWCMMFEVASCVRIFIRFCAAAIIASAFVYVGIVMYWCLK